MHDEAATARSRDVQARGEVQVSPAMRRQSLDRAAHASLTPALCFLAPMFAFLGVAHLVVLHRPVAWAMASLALATALACAGALIRIRRHPVPLARARTAAGVIASVVLANALTHLLLVGKADDTPNVLLFIVGAGFLLLSRAWLAVLVVAAWVGWVGAAIVHPQQPWGRFTFALGSATVLAGLVHTVRVRTVVHLERLRLDLERRVQERTRELESSNLLLRAVTEHLPDAISVRDRSGVHRFANSAARRLQGAGVVGETPDRLWPAELAAQERSEDADVLATGEPLRERALVVGVNGADGERHLVISKYPVRNAAGEVIGVLDVRRDVTEARRQQQSRLEIEQRLQDAQKLQSLGVLTGGIAHDFNNLLTGVLGAAGLARLDIDDPGRLDAHLSQIESSARQGSDLCRQLLAYAGRSRLLIERVELNTLVRQVLPLLRLSASRQIEIRLALAPMPLPFDGDASQIRQVVINLVINAAEAVGDRLDGLIAIRTGVDAGDDQDGPAADVSPLRYGYVEVTDNGCGMEPGVRASIFDPFFTTKFTGRGLGLAVVLGIARSHGGSVQVSSDPGRGASFRVLLPLAADGLLPVASVAPPPVSGDVALSGDVLLIDDEPVVREVVGEMLERLGLRPVVADDGLLGLERFAAEPDRYRVVVADLTMPAAGGREVLHGVRASRPELPVLLISGFSDAEIVLDDDARLRTAFLQKPFSIEALHAALAELLR